MGCHRPWLALGLSWIVRVARGSETNDSEAVAKLTDEETCPGSINMAGYGPIQIVATKWNIPGDPAEKVEVIDGKVVPNLKGRCYFADACEAGKYNNEDYVGLPLLGKTLRFKTDLSKAGCGCNAALYLTNLKQNYEISGCKDYYCDANTVCGVACPEIDIMEANKVSFHMTLHEEDDGSGVGGGYGGGGEGWNGPRDWNQSQYGPGASCIDTMKAFEVAVSFPVWTDDDNTLASYDLTLTQNDCALTVEVPAYDGNTSKWPKGGNHGIQGVSKALRDGMAPIASFWSSEDMLWMDGKGPDGKGPCEKDLTEPCPDKIEMWDFALESVPPRKRPPQPAGGGDWIYGLILGGLILVGGGNAVAYFMGFCEERGETEEELLQE